MANWNRSDPHNSLREWRPQYIKQRTFKGEQSHTKGTAAARSRGTGKCATKANKGEGDVSQVSPSLLLSGDLYHSHGTIKRVWKWEAGHQSDWFVSTKVVNPRSQRELSCFRKIVQGNTQSIDVAHSLGSDLIPVCKPLAIKALWH